MSKAEQGYLGAFKSTFIFGFVQLTTALISVLKTKLVAVWLGASGYGVISLYNTVINLIFSISNLGLQNSVVRDVAYYNTQVNKNRIREYLFAVLRWLYVFGFVGMVLMILLSPVFSKHLFGSYDKTWSIALLSIVVFMNTLYNGYYAILQGLRKISKLVKANLAGAAIGSTLAIPILYFYREQGIVLSLIITAFVMTVIAYYFTHAELKEQKHISLKKSYLLGIGTMKLGFAVALNSISASLILFVLSTYIVSLNGIQEVGIFQAGWAINDGYVGLVFLAISRDFLPRLTSTIQNKDQFASCVSQQSELSILLLGPLIFGMLLLIKPLIVLFFSKEFLNAELLTMWLLFGSFIRAGALGISHAFLAKGDAKLFIKYELLNKIIFTLPLYLLGYRYWGLRGIGLAFLVQNIAYFILIQRVVKNKYSLSYTATFWRPFVVIFFLLTLFFSIHYIYDKFYLKLLLTIMTILYSLWELNKRLGFFHRDENV